MTVDEKNYTYRVASDSLQTDLQHVLVDNYRLDYGRLYNIQLQRRMYQGTDPHIFDLSRLEFENIQHLLHIRVYIRVETHGIPVNMNTLQILVRKYDIDCWNHTGKDHMDYLLGPFVDKLKKKNKKNNSQLSRVC